MANTNLYKKTAKLFKQLVENEQTDDLDKDTVIGAHYAELALRGDVTLNDNGNDKVQTAFDTLKDLVD